MNASERVTHWAAAPSADTLVEVLLPVLMDLMV